jgi:hypothetical protein
MSGMRLIYMIGQPGAGKSTLMAKLTEHLDRDPQVSAPVPHDILRYDESRDIAGAEIGRQRDKFGGTDALPASIIEKAIPWIQTRPYPLLFAEGARLANKRFIDAACAAGYDVALVLVDHDQADKWLAARAEHIGKVQNPAWVRGRHTADLNLAKHYAERPGEGVQVYTGHPDSLITEIEHLLDV